MNPHPVYTSPDPKLCSKNVPFSFKYIFKIFLIILQVAPLFWFPRGQFQDVENFFLWKVFLYFLVQKKSLIASLHREKYTTPVLDYLLQITRLDNYVSTKLCYLHYIIILLIQYDNIKLICMILRWKYNILIKMYTKKPCFISYALL